MKIPDHIIKEVNNRLKVALESSTCIKRQIAAVLWTRDGFFANGSNGAPECFAYYCKFCPRIKSDSGEDMEICPAIHAEISAILNAMKNGHNTYDSVLFISCALPCKDCMKEIIVAGIKYIISPYPIDYIIRPDGFQANAKHYNFSLSRRMMEECGIKYIHNEKLIKEYGDERD